MDKLVVAMDGPSGTGKSSVSRLLAARLAAAYLDTGAMYRVATLAALRAGADLDDPDSINAAVAGVHLGIGTNPSQEMITLGGEDVRDEIRGNAVTKAVSAVSAVPEVRAWLVDRQRSIAAEHDRIVVEGRDIGTVVLTDADVKIYLTATAEARALRRNQQNIAEGRGDDFDAVLADVQRRDGLDSSRKASPLRQADDAIAVDSSVLGRDEVVEELYRVVCERTGIKA